ncbi:MAG: PTS IIA-like nitrogen regulatory protein PtsN [Alphaproteobacteria bacterium]
MVALGEILNANSIIPELPASSKKQVLQDLAKRAAKETGLAAQALFDALLERERLGSTGVGHGIAIPHGTLKELTRIYGFFARLEKPIDFDAADDQPVDLIFVLLAPENAGADHLKTLTKLSRIFRDEATCNRLRELDSPEGLLHVFTGNAASFAA